MTVRKLRVPKDDAGIRLDCFLARELIAFSRAYLQKLIRSGALSMDGRTVATVRTALPGDAVLLLQLPESSEPVIAPAAEFDFPILYEDADILVIAKPAGVVVHPAPGNRENTVVNALLARYPALAANAADPTRPGIVHRLDKDTSGCLIAALSPMAHAKLATAFAERDIVKTYLAITAGIPNPPQGRIESLIGRHPVNRQKMAVVDRNGKNAVTCYKTLGSGKIGNIPAALLEVSIMTGRTHQIRVHLATLNTPVAGDGVYGGARRIPAARQLLHAWKLEFHHPITGVLLTLTAPWPEDFAGYAAQLGAVKLERKP